MEKELAEKVVEGLEALGIDAELREEYSGRGMFGKVTAGIVSRRLEDILFVMGAVAAEQYGFENISMFPLEKIRSDNMARDVIVY